MKLKSNGRVVQADQASGKPGVVAVVSGPLMVPELEHPTLAERRRASERESVLYKRLAGVDAVNIELQADDPSEVIQTCHRLEPRFAGLKLQNVKAPECFQIEEGLRATLGIPVLHDDHFGTATLSGAGLLNAIQIAGKRIDSVRVVFDTAGPSAITCAQHYIRLGVRSENITICDVDGVVSVDISAGMYRYGDSLALKGLTLADAMDGADVLIDLSLTNCISDAMLAGMNFSPIVFALTDNSPSLSCEAALKTHPYRLLFTRRSGLPNQLGNILGAPAIFRGALDVGAVTINDEMMIAASVALANLAKEDVPEALCRIYSEDRLVFGRGYMIPKPFDSRGVIRQAVAVASAAMKTGVSRRVVDLDNYRKRLERSLDSLSGTEARVESECGAWQEKPGNETHNASAREGAYSAR